ncbi:unnamed protein product [Heligmosomoides polygyrus]|uniref:Uncharacterized protein n=1 Tax=Heligmosomoides polygyrus TaxID=6339 RepID=A0A183GSU3_HELPZ|nr:unnamed protein product [Heligmosomoides polygyrus]
MLAHFDRICGNVALQLNLTKTLFTKDLIPFCTISAHRNEHLRELQLYVLHRGVNMANDLVPEQSRRKRAKWRAFRIAKELVSGSGPTCSTLLLFLR